MCTGKPSSLWYKKLMLFFKRIPSQLMLFFKIIPSQLMLFFKIIRSQLMLFFKIIPSQLMLFFKIIRSQLMLFFKIIPSQLMLFFKRIRSQLMLFFKIIRSQKGKDKTIYQLQNPLRTIPSRLWYPDLSCLYKYTRLLSAVMWAGILNLPRTAETSVDNMKRTRIAAPSV